MIQKIRGALFWLHLGIGVVVGLFILSMAVSGILIAYSKPITALAESSQKTVVVPNGAKPLDVEALVAKVQRERPQAHLSGIMIYSDPTAAAMLNVGRDSIVIYANPYTGEIQGDGQKTVRGFFQFMTTWHRWLALEGTARPVGNFITSAAAILYFVMLVTGLIIWLPKHWSGKRIRQGAVLNLKLSGKARDWNWHNVIGLWCSPLLFIITFTAICMSQNWASDMLYRVTGNPVPDHKRDGGRNFNGNGPSSIDVSGINPLWAQAEKQVPGWHSISLRLSGNSDAPANFQIDTGDVSRPDTAAQLTINRDDGEIDRWQPYASENAGQKLRSWLKPIHTGEAGGIIGESLAVIAALGTIILVWTGYSLAYRRFRPQR